VPDRKAWIAPLGVSIVCLFLAAGLASFPFAASVLVVLSGISGCMAVYSAVLGRLNAGRLSGGRLRLGRDKYDLSRLREVDEEMREAALEPGHVSPDADEIFCLRCGRAYQARIPVCPYCGHSA
jgi:hypothetical protein